jgi:hypothetical protein
MEDKMRIGTKKPILFFACLALMLSGLSVSASAQDKTKLYNEIAGDYEFEVEGQILVIVFSVEDGVLYGDTEGDPGPPSEIEPVEGKELEFTATGTDGNLYEITFSRDEEGKITKCLLSVMGMELEGVKIK